MDMAYSIFVIRLCVRIEYLGYCIKARYQWDNWCAIRVITENALSPDIFFSALRGKILPICMRKDAARLEQEMGDIHIQLAERLSKECGQRQFAGGLIRRKERALDNLVVLAVLGRNAGHIKKLNSSISSR